MCKMQKDKNKQTVCSSTTRRRKKKKKRPHYLTAGHFPVRVAHLSYLKKNIVPGSPSFAECSTPITKIFAASLGKLVTSTYPREVRS